eukprot:g75798.t1
MPRIRRILDPSEDAGKFPSASRPVRRTPSQFQSASVISKGSVARDGGRLTNLPDLRKALLIYPTITTDRADRRKDLLNCLVFRHRLASVLSKGSATR